MLTYSVHLQGMLKVQGVYLTMDLCKPISSAKKDWTCALVRIASLCAVL